MKYIKYTIGLLVSAALWALVFIYGISNGCFLRAFAPDSTSSAFIEAAQEKVDDEFVGNLAMVLVNDGRVDKEYYYSIDDSINRHTVFQVASVSKWVSAWGVMALVQENKLDLDLPIEEYLTRWHLPPSEFDNNKVTVRRLLSHTAGLVDDLGYDGFGPDQEIQTIEESLTKAADAYYSEGVAKVGYEPGSQYMYSGAGYTILQLVIEEVSGVSFEEYMTQTVFRPLGMERSTFDLDDRPDLKLAKLYNSDGTISQGSRFTALAAASLYTCADDLSKILIASCSENPVLTKASLELMSQPEAYINSYPVYGLGPHLYSQKSKKSNVVGHDGSSGSPVINTAARIDLMSKVGIIILEMGNHNIASNMADEWLFWKFGIADYVVIQRNKPMLLGIFLLGCLIIVALLFLISQRFSK